MWRRQCRKPINGEQRRPSVSPQLFTGFRFEF
jgi:hypothetical protein